MRKKSRAQSVLEYAVLIIVVAAALLAMRIYFIRAVQEKYRQSADVIGEGEQYVPGATQVTDNNEESFDPVITDPARDTCPNILERVRAMQREINGYDLPLGCEAPNCTHMDGLTELADKYEAQAADLDVQIATLEGQGMSQQAIPLKESARILREKAVFMRDKAQLRTDQINNLKFTRPECFR